MTNSISIIFLLFVLIFSSIKGIRSILLLEKTEYDLLSKINAEIELRRCGELLATKKNLIDAATFFSDVYPILKNEIKMILDENLENLRDKFNNDEEYFSEICYSSEIPDIAVTPHHQYNPDIDRNWPNWYFKWNLIK